MGPAGRCAGDARARPLWFALKPLRSLRSPSRAAEDRTPAHSRRTHCNSLLRAATAAAMNDAVQSTWSNPVVFAPGSLRLDCSQQDAQDLACCGGEQRHTSPQYAFGETQGRREGRGLGTSGLRASLARRRGARYRPAVGSVDLSYKPIIRGLAETPASADQCPKACDYQDQRHQRIDSQLDSPGQRREHSQRLFLAASRPTSRGGRNRP